MNILLSQQFSILPGFGFGILSLREEDLWSPERDYPGPAFCNSTETI